MFTTIDDPAPTNGTSPIGINNNGQIVGVYTDGSGAHGFLYDRGTFTTIDDPLGSLNQANGINDRGQIVGPFATALLALQSFE